ncbi:MAG: hypothetical protein WD358_04200 [Nitriliruptoraceae bacterium]
MADKPEIGDDHAMADKPVSDVFAAPQASPKFAKPLALLAFGFAVLTLVTGLAPVTGPVGMGIGLIAHLKGSRLGIAAAFACGAAMIAAMAFSMYLR